MQLKEFGTIASANQGTPLVEAYGLLLASVLLGSNGKPPRVLAISAAQSGDGCSTTAVNLAIMMARTSRPTVLIDANLRDPQLHKAAGVPQAPGLAEMLTGKASMENLGVATSVPHLSLIPSGQMGEMPAQALISHPMLGDLVRAARQRFELVVVDTPPVLQFPDALHIAKVVDGVILVVSPQGTSRRQQQEMRRLLERVEAHIVGTVLNRVRSRAMVGP